MSLTFLKKLPKAPKNRKPSLKRLITSLEKQGKHVCGVRADSQGVFLQVSGKPIQARNPWDED